MELIRDFLTANLDDKGGCTRRPLHIISSRSVTDGVSLSASKLKLVYSRLIFVDNKLTLMCMLQSVKVSLRYAQVILLIWRVLHLRGQKSKENRRMTRSTNLPVTSPNVCLFQKFFHQQIER